MSIDLQTLHQRAEDAEGRSRRNNVRFLGIPEGLEKPNVDLFLEKWLSEEILEGKILRFFSIERSHRMPGRPPPPGSPARPILAKFLNYRDRDLILRSEERR